MSGHFLKQCHTPKHRVNMFQAFLKSKGKNVETKYIDDSDPVDVTYLDVSDFFKDKNGKIDHLISDGNVHHNKTFNLCFMFVHVNFIFHVI